MSNLLRTVEVYLRDTGIKPSAFGRRTVNDPSLVYGMRAGRTPRPKTEQAIRAAMAQGASK